MAETSTYRRIVVGYALAPDKQRTIIRPSLIGAAHDRGIDMVPIDASRRLADQGPFDCVLHKLRGEDWKAQVEEFAAKNPGVPIVDPPIAIERLHDRVSMLQVVSDLEIPRGSETLGIPSQAVIHDHGELSDSAIVGPLRFPLIAKPLVSDGSANSHSMALVFHRGGLLQLKPPLVLQEFVNHGGVVFKVYVVGDCVQCVKRKSLPDVPKEILDSSDGLVAFSQVSNSAAAVDLDEAEMPPLGFLEGVAKDLRRALGLHLFNFDVIRDVKVGSHYLVIDINYFPGYYKMPDYERILTDFVWHIVQEKKADQAITNGEGAIVANSHQRKMVEEDANTADSHQCKMVEKDTGNSAG